MLRDSSFQSSVLKENDLKSFFTDYHMSNVIKEKKTKTFVYIYMAIYIGYLVLKLSA